MDMHRFLPFVGVEKENKSKFSEDFSHYLYQVWLLLVQIYMIIFLFNENNLK